MPLNGNMKPLIRIDGRKKKNDICIAWSWFLASVLNRKPMARLAAMKTRRPSARARRAAEHRHVEQQQGGADDDRDLDQPDADERQQLADHHLERGDRHGEQVLHGAALALAGDGERGHDHHGHGQDGADQARARCCSW